MQIDFYFLCHQPSSGVPGRCLFLDFMSQVHQVLYNRSSEYRQIDLNEDVSALRRVHK